MSTTLHETFRQGTVYHERDTTVERFTLDWWHTYTGVPAGHYVRDAYRELVTTGRTQLGWSDYTLTAE